MSYKSYKSYRSDLLDLLDFLDFLDVEDLLDLFFALTGVPGADYWGSPAQSAPRMSKTGLQTRGGQASSVFSPYKGWALPLGAGLGLHLALPTRWRDDLLLLS
jgi:hypothetical protein